MNILKLKVNIKSLASEAKHIRKEEQKIKKDRGGDNAEFESLQYHRLWEVGPEARASQLLYGFLRGKGYRTIEPHCDKQHYKYFLMLRRLEAKCKKLKVSYEEVLKWFRE